jgi:hypothetical protein
VATHFIPNSRVSVYRDDEETGNTDAWGQDVPLTLPSEAAALVWPPRSALITDRGQKTRQPASGSAIVVHEYTIRLRPGSHIFRESDRIYDHVGGVEYAVDKIKTNNGGAQHPDPVLVCRRVS